MQSYLDFEKPVAELRREAEALRAQEDDEHRAAALEARADRLMASIYANLSPWQRCQIARHQDRPRCHHYIDTLCADPVSLAGDRGFAEDQAVIGCLARFDDKPIMVIGHEKGKDTNSRIRHNFGMARPEGYRKAVRLMDLAERFRLPVVTLVDTPGAYPGKGAEERGQSEAIAQSIRRCLTLRVPLIAIVIGEGGSGGAVAFAAADRTAMLEHSIYSVISPEGCASILWKDAGKTQEAAQALRLTAQDLLGLKVIDRVIAEPAGGAQRDSDAAISAVGDVLHVIPVHTCVVTNLHNKLYGVRGDSIEQVWDVAARGMVW